jgi:leucyl-tRNA synthetase
MDYIAIHKKWKEYWAREGVNKFDAGSQRPKYYCLQMFPYPSGANLHLGHYMNYAPSDTHSRFKRMTGFNVFQPMGFDAFGLPAENFALKTGTHPYENTVKNMDIMRRQLEGLGGMYDWDYSVTTCFEDYYKWTQWLFVELYKAGLAYQKNAPVNWCDKCKTVLANEQVLDGECERCQGVIIRKQMNQWFFKITDYAEKLLSGLEGLDWPHKTKTMQKNWIGKSVGSRLSFVVCSDSSIKDIIEVFTTRADTLYGVTFITVAPEHALVEKLVTGENKKACADYVSAAAKKSDIERLGSDSEKTGVFTGSYAINPVNGVRVPVYIGDYVLATYGTGAVMAVPMHDDRDFLFAQKYNLPLVSVIAQDQKAEVATDETKKAFTDDGFLFNSERFDGLTSAKAREEITKELQRGGLASFETTYRLRDWGIGRQRYWGCPIPIVHCEKCGAVAETRLPVVLPKIADFSPKGASPLASIPEFVNCTCPQCGISAKREVDTMDTFVCSSWYFLRFPDAKNENEAFNKATARKMLPVDKYIGGAEHACMHLLYARFVTMFLHDKGYLNFTEPFTSLVHQGMILGTDGQKMSKSKGNTREPDLYTSQYGDDILRLFIMFSFNYIEGGPWSDNALKTVTRFTERIEGVINQAKSAVTQNPSDSADKELLFVLNNTIKSVRVDLDAFSFNTAVARCMELLNALTGYLSAGAINAPVLTEVIKKFVLVLAPLIPHIAEEYWEMLGGKPSVFNQPYPVVEDKYLVRDEIEIAVQINSKIVSRVNIPSSATQDIVEGIAKNDEKAGAMIAGKVIKKVIYVAGKLINFIV